MNTAALSRALDELDATDLEHLAGVLRERARMRRVLLTYDEALDAFEQAPVSIFWARSPYTDVGRIRTACRILVAERRWHPEQIIEAMTTIALEVCPHPLVAHEAVARGIADGRRVLESRANGE
jgi:hypothetical protein